jgi:hypothetical protein
MSSTEDKSRGFVVTDRRSFTDAGEPPPAESQPAASAPVDSPSAAAPASKAGGLPPVDFHTFVLSLGSSALIHLGDLERPEAGKAEKDLPMAKHTIDLLSMLQDKTKGNLSAEEAALLESLLYDLRLRYVSAAK